MGLNIGGVVSKRQKMVHLYSLGDGTFEPIALTYRPNYYDAEYAEKIRTKGEQEDVAAFTISVFLELVEKWDVERPVVSEQGKVIRYEVIPLTPDDLRSVPTNFLDELIGAVRADMLPKDTNDPNSRATGGTSGGS